MSVEDKHPSFLMREEEYQICSDVLRGSQAVKEAREAYLPCPSGFSENPDPKIGKDLYDAYLRRAEFPELYALTLRGMVGLIHRQEAVVEGLEGTPLESMHERCTRPDRHPTQTLMSFHQSLTEQLLHKGRASVLTDMASGGSDVPWLAMYEAEALTNWSPDGKLFVLNESGLVRSAYDEFAWVQAVSYRVLRLIEGTYIGQIYTDQPGEDAAQAGLERDRVGGAPIRKPELNITPQGTPRLTPAQASGVTGPRPAELGAAPAGVSVNSAATITAQDVYTPKYRGGKPLDFIPIVVGGPLRMGLEPETPPILGVGRAALSIYRLNADYRHQLFMSGQETMYATGVTKETVPRVVGAGVIVGLPTGSVLAYASPSCSGIDAHAKAIGDEEQRAVAAGVQLVDQGGSQQSGDALRLRYGSQTATLITVSRQSAAMLEISLRNAARIINMPQEQIERIIVKPNLEFLETIMSAQDASQLVTVWQSGAISYATLYENFVRGGIASGERTADEEQELVDSETPDAPLAGENISGESGRSGSSGSSTGAVGDDEPNDGDGTEAGPDSITDEELLATFGDFASDVVD